MRIAALEQDVGFGAHDEEGRTEREAVESLEIDVAAVHDVERPGLRPDLVEDVDVMHFAVRDADKRGDVAMQIQQGVHLDGALMLAKLGPWEQRQAQVDGRGIQRVEAVRQVHADGIAGIKWPGDTDQDLREVGIDPPVMALVGIGQRGARHPATEAHVVELAAHRPQTRLYVAQTLAVSQLREGHRQVLVPTREASRVGIAAIASYAFLEFLAWGVRDQLGEDGAAGVHPPLFRSGDALSSGPNASCDFKSFPRQETASP